MIIWEFPLETTDINKVEMPVGAEILTCQVQIGQFGLSTPCLWALVNPAAPKETRIIRIIGTGHPVLNEDLHYISTIQMLEGKLVFHVFEKKVPQPIKTKIRRKEKTNG